MAQQGSYRIHARKSNKAFPFPGEIVFLGSPEEARVTLEQVNQETKSRCCSKNWHSFDWARRSGCTTGEGVTHGEEASANISSDKRRTEKQAI